MINVEEAFAIQAKALAEIHERVKELEQRVNRTQETLYQAFPSLVPVATPAAAVGYDSVVMGSQVRMPRA